MSWLFEYNAEKNLLLKASRGVNFDDVIFALKKGEILDDVAHKQRSNQRLFVVNINGYAYAVPYIMGEKENTFFLKTLYPSRKLTQKYLRRTLANG